MVSHRSGKGLEQNAAGRSVAAIEKNGLLPVIRVYTDRSISHCKITASQAAHSPTGQPGIAWIEGGVLAGRNGSMVDDLKATIGERKSQHGKIGHAGGSTASGIGEFGKIAAWRSAAGGQIQRGTGCTGNRVGSLIVDQIPLNSGRAAAG